MAVGEADELDLGRVGLYMYQQITKRYVLLRCDYPASGFYQTDQIQAYPSRSLDLPSRCLFSIETRGQLGARHRLGLPHQRQAAYPMTSSRGPQIALIVPF